MLDSHFIALSTSLLTLEYCQQQYFFYYFTFPVFVIITAHTCVASFYSKLIDMGIVCIARGCTSNTSLIGTVKGPSVNGPDIAKGTDVFLLQLLKGPFNWFEKDLPKGP